MATRYKKELRIATIVFWVLLLYIIAALIWWFVSLERQNHLIHQLKREQVENGQTNNEARLENIRKIDRLESRNSQKYIGEGITFLLLIIIGAFYIYRLVQRQFQWQQQQQNFVMAITHELKTPIAVARINLETLQKHHLPEERQKKMLFATLDETIRLDTLINNILISSQLDGDAYKGDIEELNFSELVKDSIREFSIRYPDRPIVSNIPDDIELKGDTVLLQLLISNLLENANKYAPKKTEIKASLTEKNKTISLAISDKGIGIPDDEKKKIFQKFYRVGSEQTRLTKGTGLGLFICKKIADHHKADIVVSDNEGGGTIFTVVFRS